MKSKLSNHFLLFFALFCISLYLCSCAHSAPASAATHSTDTAAKAPAVQNSIQTVKDSIKKPATAIRKFTQVDARTYTVEVIIRDVTEPKSFKKLLEKLPDGYTVSSESLNDPAARFKPGELKYVWVANYERDFSVTYTLKIPKHKKLIRDYEGYFAYIDNNAKVSVNVQSSE
ncbi:MAG: hypothetical protein JWP12_259 [Bacteroidetes bacterium]|nr:hypothetical protein [Bacteroidota bacterium]